jgi:tRNA(Ile)-lysidine synthase
MNTLLAEVARALPSESAVIAISGGADSVALTRSVLACVDASYCGILAHVNHQLRGSESDDDEHFVRSFHAQLLSSHPQLRLAITRIDVAHIAETEGENLEAIARRERYRFLVTTARQAQLHHILTAHNAEDQAETVLHHLLRGTGFEGLRGIAVRREIEPGIEIVRPLLQVSRTRIEGYLQELGQTYRHDSSNDDLRFTRNRLRHELLPRLAQEYNPQIAQALARLALQAQEVCQAEEQLGAALLRAALLPASSDCGERLLDVAQLRQHPRRVVRTALRLLWLQENWCRDRLGWVELEALADLVWSDHGARDLPGGVHARRARGQLRLGLRGGESVKEIG